MEMILALSAVSLLMSAGSAAVEPLTAVPFTEVTVADNFWSRWVAVEREHVLPHNFKFCESEGKIDNFLIVAGKKEGKHHGAYWEDSDLYKVIEGAAYCLADKRDAALEKHIDDLAEIIAGAQQPDGYLDTYFTLVEPDKRWTDDSKHETYCAGHFIEAAVAYYQATGKRNLLDVAIKLADHMYTVFGPGKQTDVSEHEEIELALVKLWRATGDAKYLELAELFVERRGHYEGRHHKIADWVWGEYCQDAKPVREQSEITGHAVRAMYLYSGVADLAAINGDTGYIDAMDRIWRDVTQTKMYLTGGIGSSGKNEGFTGPYDLPNDTAYCETCASVGMAPWNHRMTLLHRDAKYADIVEREIYNGLLSGVSLNGETYFYVNPLSSRGAHHRQPWHGCSCCPTNIARFLPTVGGYVYARADNAIYVNHYIAGSGKIALNGKVIKLDQETRYPWEGNVKIKVEPQAPAKFALHLRIPGWCQGAHSDADLYAFPGKPENGTVTLAINGSELKKFPVAKGYAVIDREWKAGDIVDLVMPMPVRRVKANPKVQADAGRIALQRGPVVYCLEGVDNDNYVFNLAIPANAEIKAEFRPDLLNGVTVLTGTALAKQKSADPQRTAFTAIPYFAWDNREPGQMQVWIPEDVATAEARPDPTIAGESRATASHVFDSLQALNDQVEPKNSNDQSIPRFTWWDHRGTQEWVQYEFKKPTRVSAVEVYWFDDTGTGGCRVPQRWRVVYKDGDKWEPVHATSEYATATDKYNRATLDPIDTDGLRIEVVLQDGFSGGVLEWRVE